MRDLWQAREQRDALAVAVNERDAKIARLRAALEMERNLLGRIESFASAFLDHSSEMRMYGCVKNCANALRSSLKELSDRRAARLSVDVQSSVPDGTVFVVLNGKIVGVITNVGDGPFKK